MKKLLPLILLFYVYPLIGMGQQAHVGGGLDSMVSTERAFAATSLKEGIRASFLKFFEDSALAFSPEPYVFKQAAAKRPPPADPLARTLRWEPVAGDISTSGDMGYLMGPSTLTDNSQPKAPPSYGFYLSVWRKQDDGTWKVIIDIGTTVAKEITRFFGSKFTPLGRDGYITISQRADLAVARNELLGMDRSFSKTATAKNLRSAYADVLDDSARAIRESVGPIAGKDSIIAYVTRHQDHLSLHPINAGVSRAGDLGYTYGSYKIVPDSAKPSGYYVRVWKKTTGNVWKLVVDKDAPAEEK